MSGYIVETAQEPQYKSVEAYVEYLKRQSPNPDLKYDLMDPDIKCTCCGQEAPHVAAALLKVQDTTPYTVELAGEPGHQLWLCADCYTNGVRPKSIHYGEVRWNKQGRRIRQRAQKKRGHPW